MPRLQVSHLVFVAIGVVQRPDLNNQACRRRIFERLPVVCQEQEAVKVSERNLVAEVAMCECEGSRLAVCGAQRSSAVCAKPPHPSAIASCCSCHWRILSSSSNRSTSSRNASVDRGRSVSTMLLQGTAANFEPDPVLVRLESFERLFKHVSGYTGVARTQAGAVHAQGVEQLRRTRKLSDRRDSASRVPAAALPVCHLRVRASGLLETVFGTYQSANQS